MARGPSQRTLYAALEERYGKTIADAFLAAIDDLRRAAELQRAIDAVRARDLDALTDALHLDPAVYGDVLDQIAAAYREGGEGATRYMPAKDAEGLRLVVRFDVRNPRAEDYLRQHSSQLVTRITADQREAIRIALEAGLARGENPTTTALDIVGRVDRTVGKRVGGVIGLTSQQSEFVANARAELASGDPEQLQHYLDRKLRDRRFDRSVLKAIADGKPIPADSQAGAITSYQNKLLKLRGDTIGRTESISALRASKREAYRQAVESGKVAESAITRRWRSAGDHAVRDSHELLNGMKIQGLARPYVSPLTGARMLFPGDTSLGAPAKETIGCRCDEDIRIDFLADLG